MLNNPDLKANATARPAKTNGIEVTIVSDSG
jgi:hypothetical protein